MTEKDRPIQEQLKINGSSFITINVYVVSAGRTYYILLEIRLVC